MRKYLIPLALVPLVAAPTIAHTGPEPHPAVAADVVTFTQPIAGIENNYWFDYRSDLEEAESELRSDLRRATDAEDRNDAWEEYTRELADAADDYAGEMAERGYRSGVVTLGGSQ